MRLLVALGSITLLLLFGAAAGAGGPVDLARIVSPKPPLPSGTEWRVARRSGYGPAQLLRATDPRLKALNAKLLRAGFVRTYDTSWIDATTRDGTNAFANVDLFRGRPGAHTAAIALAAYERQLGTSTTIPARGLGDEAWGTRFQISRNGTTYDGVVYVWRSGILAIDAGLICSRAGCDGVPVVRAARAYANAVAARA